MLKNVGVRFLITVLVYGWALPWALSGWGTYSWARPAAALFDLMALVAALYALVNAKHLAEASVALVGVLLWVWALSLCGPCTGARDHPPPRPSASG
jgi:hypothetical protein